MPIYLFSNPKTGKVKEVVQSMSEPHVYSENGVAWNRIWSIPQTRVDSVIDPFSQKEFIEKTGNKTMTQGEYWEMSQAMSEKREKKAGLDPVKEKYFKSFEKKHHGKPHPIKKKEIVKAQLDAKGVILEG